MNWEKFSFLRRSELRIRLLNSLLDTPKTPTQLKNEFKNSIALSSRCLKQFQERGLVECLTGEEKMWKLFKTTENGKKILKKQEKN